MDTDVVQERLGAGGPYYAVSPESLRRARRERFLTQQRLAEVSGVHRATISQAEAGNRRQVRPGTLRQLARALGVEPEELLVDRGHREEAQDER